MTASTNKSLRVAVLDPSGFRGGQARALQMVAEALYVGSREVGQPVEVVIGYLDSPRFQVDDFRDLRPEIKLRSFVWKELIASEALRALVYSGTPVPSKLESGYMVPDDGVNNFYDCDLWLIISDRLIKPLLPIRPYVLMVYDYIQRYVPEIIPEEVNLSFLRAARQATGVLVTTQFTLTDALQYAGLAPERVHKVPMLIPCFSATRVNGDAPENRNYFIWTTSSSIHKNHVNAVLALRIYYEELEGELSCLMTGFNSEAIVSGRYPHLEPVRDIIAKSDALRSRLQVMGELPDARYRDLLAHARFLWHPARIDNGTFSVVEAACLGVPSLSSDYPAMREMDGAFKLTLSWSHPDEPRQMALQLKHMELVADEIKQKLPTEAELRAFGDAAMVEYWKVIQLCL